MKINSILTGILIILGSSSLTFAITADEIMKKVDDRDTGETQISTATMTLIDKKDRKRVKNIN